jgi:hypothetical protein
MKAVVLKWRDCALPSTGLPVSVHILGNMRLLEWLLSNVDVFVVVVVSWDERKSVLWKEPSGPKLGRASATAVAHSRLRGASQYPNDNIVIVTSHVLHIHDITSSNNSSLLH